MHPLNCKCSHCRPSWQSFAAQQRQPLPIIPMSYATNTIETLGRETECYGEGWSNAQHCRREEAA